MNWLFRISVGLAFLVVVVLFTALIAPRFVNWDRFINDFEREASEFLGLPVELGSASQVRLLPLPRITFENIKVGSDPESGPVLGIERFSMDAELLPFLSGEVRIVEITLQRPQFHVHLNDAGGVDWQTQEVQGLDWQQVNIETLRVEDGSIRIDGLKGDRDISIAGINGLMSADTLLGPWRFDASAMMGALPTSFSISTGTYQKADRSVRLRFRGQRDDQPYELQIDGPVSVQDAGLQWNGDFQLTPFPEDQVDDMIDPVAPLPVSIDGQFAASSARIDIPDYRAEVGSTADPYVINGFADLTIEDQIQFAAKADGQQVNLSRIEALQQGDGGGTMSLRRRLDALRQIVDRLPVPSVSGSIDIALPAIVAGDTYIRQVSALLQPNGTDWEIGKLSAEMPGNTRIEATGRMGVGENFGFTGEVLLASRQPSGFAAWVSGDVASAIRRLRTLGFTSNVTITPRQATFDGLELRLDDAILTGRIQRLSSDERRPALIVQLNGNRVNLEDLRALYSLTRDASSEELTSHDLNIKIKADLLQAKYGDVSLDAEGVEGHLQVRDGAISVENFKAAEFFGAAVNSAGRIENLLSKPQGNLELSVEANEGSGLLELADSLFGESAVTQTLARAPELTRDTRLNVILDSSATDDGATGKLIVSGETGGTKIVSNIDFDGTPGDLQEMQTVANVTLENDRPARLMRQFGLDAIEPLGLVTETEPVRMSVGVRGTAAEGYDSQISISDSQTNLVARGIAKLPDQKSLEAQMKVTLGSSDVVPYLLTSGYRIPGLTFGSAWPVSLSFDLNHGADKSELSGLSGQLNGNALEGNLLLERGSVARPKVTGDLDLGALSLPLIGELVFGLSQAGASDEGNQWSNRAFGDPMLAGIDAQVELNAERIVTGFDVEATNGQASFVVLDGALDINDASANLLGGSLNGALELSNSAGTVLMKARYNAKDFSVDTLAGHIGLNGLASGSAGIQGVVEATGLSTSALISGLSGNGLATFSELIVNDVNPSAFPAILEAVDGEGFEIGDESVSRVVSETVFNSALQIDALEASYSVSQGVLGVRNLTHETDEVTLESGIRFDLSDSEIQTELDVAFKPERREKIEGTDPQVTLSWTGQPGSLERAIDASLLQGYLSVRAFEASQRRVETLEARVIEKQRLNRQLAYLFQREQYQIRKAEERRQQIEEQKRLIEAEETRRFEEAERALRQEQERRQADVERRQREAEEQARREAEEAARQAEEARQQEAAELREQQRLEAERQAEQQRQNEVRTNEQENEEEPQIRSLPRMIFDNIEEFLENER